MMYNMFTGTLYHLLNEMSSIRTKFLEKKMKSNERGYIMKNLRSLINQMLDRATDAQLKAVYAFIRRLMRDE